MTESVAYKSLFFPIFFLSIIFTGFIVYFVISGFSSAYTVIGLKYFSFLFVPFILLLFFKITKPKILISRNQNNFIIHYHSKKVSIPFNEIVDISYDSLLYSSTIIIKTKVKKYRIRDVKSVYKVYKAMMLILNDHGLIK